MANRHSTVVHAYAQGLASPLPLRIYPTGLAMSPSPAALAPGLRRGHSLPVKRVAILGPGGAGKSRLAVELGAAIETKVIYLDRLFWKPGWVPRPKEEWDAMQRRERAGDSWIVEGLTEGAMDPWLDEADTVLFLDTPPLICIWRVTRRRLNAEAGVGMPLGCEPAPFYRAFLKFVRRLLQFQRTTRPAIQADLARRANSQRIVVLRNERESREFLKNVRSRGESDGRRT